MRALTFDAAFQDAFRLAFFLHGERATAWAIATEAFAQLKVAATAQRKRFYYRPRGERSKVELSERQLLQRLVLIASEPHERASEAAGRCTQADLALRFVKHLVRITMKRNSFHVSLGLARVLHDYPTAAAMDLYGLLLADPARNPDDPYYRSRKRLLLAELAERFGPLVELVRGPGGEDRFASQPAGPFAGLVRRALAAFAPWGISSEIPRDWTPARGGIPALQAAGGKPSELELRRIFVLLHPPGFDRLLASLRLPVAAERLALPVFRSEAAAGGPEDPPEPPEPTAAEIAAAQAELARRAQARRQPMPAWLAVRVDGLLRARLELDGGPRELRLAEAAERIEIISGDGERPALLALHLLTAPPPESPAATERCTVRLAAGARLELRIGPPEPDGSRRLQASYLRPAGWRRTVAALAAAPGWLRPVAAAAVLVTLSLLAFPYLPTRRSPVPPSLETAETEREITRGPAAERRPGPRGAVTVWLEPPPADVDPALTAALRRGLGRRLAGLTLSSDRDAADLALRWLPVSGGSALALVTREGRVLWQRAPAPGLAADRQAAAWLAELTPHLRSPAATARRP